MKSGILFKKSRIPLLFFAVSASLGLNFETTYGANPISLNTQVVGQSSPYSATYSGTLSASITTTVSNTLLVAYVSWEGAGLTGTNKALTSFTDGGSSGLTWTKRTAYYNAANQSQEIWWAYAPTAQTYTATATWTSANVDDTAINLMAFTGVDANSPWDSTSATLLTPPNLSGSFSTSNSNTYLLAFYGNCWPASPATPIPNGVVSQISLVTNGGAWWYQYAYVIGGAVNTTQNNISLGWTSVSGYQSTSFVILDALKGSGQNVPITINSVATASKNQASNIIFNLPSSPGTVSVYANGHPVPRCFKIAVGAVASFTCQWKPAITGNNSIYATYTATGSPVVSSVTPTMNVMVSKRSSAR